MGVPEATENAENDTISYIDPPLSYHSVDEEKQISAITDPTEIPQDEANPDDTVWKPGVREWLVLVCVSTLAMMDAFCATTVVSLIPGLSKSFSSPLATTLWCATGYLLANAASQAFFFLLSEVFGHGPLLLIAVVVSTIGTGICGGSSNLPTLIAGRFIQGIGGGGATSISLLIVADIIPHPYRGRFSGYVSMNQVAGAILGPFLGGIFIDYVEYSWAFYFNLVFCALGMLMIPFAIDLRGQKGDYFYKLRVVDWIGAFLTMLGIGCLLVGLSFGGTLYQWADWQTLTPLGIGGASIIALVVYENTWAVQPLFSSTVFRSHSAVMAYIGSFLHGLLMFCQLQYLIIYLASIKLLALTSAGVSLMAITGFSLLTTIFSNRYAKTPRSSPWIIRAGWILNILATALLIVLYSQTPTVGWIFIFFTAGMGHGLLISGYNTYMQAFPQKRDGEDEHRVSASAMIMYSFLRTWGMCIAIPVGGAMLLNQMNGDIVSISNDDFDNGRGKRSLITSEGITNMHFIRLVGFQIVWQVFTGVAALGGITSCFVTVKREK